VFTVWVVRKRQTPHVGVYEAANVTDAMRDALQKAAAEWNCTPDELSIVGIVEGDLRELERKDGK